MQRQMAETGPSPKAVQAALDAVQPGIQIQITGVLTDTARAAAGAARCELGQIVKSLLFVAGGRPILLLVAGDRKADLTRLAPLLGVPRKRITMASPPEVKRLTGYEVGAVPPLGHPVPLETLIDRSLERFDEVYASAGAANAIFKTTPAQLTAMTGGRIADITA